MSAPVQQPTPNPEPRVRRVSRFRQPEVQLLRAERPQGDALRRHDRRRSARSGTLSAAGLDHLFPRWTPTYSKDWTAAKSSNWHKFRAVDQEWERTHYQRQSTICGMIQNVIENGRKSGAPSRFDKTWVKVLQDHLGAYKHAEFGLGTSTMQAQRYGYTQMVNNAILTNSSYKLRFAQDLTLYLGETRDSTSAGASTPPPARSTGWKIRSGRARASRSRRSWARPTISSNTSRPMWCSSRWSANYSAAASSCSWPRRRATSSRRPWSRPPRPTTSAISPIRSSCSISWPTTPEYGGAQSGRVQRVAGQAWRACARGRE